MARRLRSRPTAWISAVVVVALTVVVGVLVVVAVDRSRPAPTDESLAPIPTFGAVSPTPTSTPTPTNAPVAPIARAEERFLTVSSEGVLWRGIAGSCVDGVAPLIERSVDGGDSWNDVTPLYLGITQITRLDAFAGTQAQTVALYEDCAVDGLRTFTQGRFWESYEEVLSESAFIAGDDAGRVVTPGGTIAAPCPEARSLRGGSSTVAMVCGGQAFRLADEEWQPLSVENVVAVVTDDSSFVVAHVDPDCAGLTVSSVTDTSATPIGCVADIDATKAITIQVSDGSALIWSGETFTSIQIT